MHQDQFVHLHLHTHYSLLDGATRISALMQQVKDMGMPAVAITDHGNLFGAIEFYNEARAAGVKPIIGCEVYIAPGDRREKSSRGMKEASNHLLLLAQNHQGYLNLLKLASIAYLEGFYYRPRIDREVLAEHSAGLLCTSTCLAGEIPQALMADNRAAAKEIAEAYLKIFGPDRFFIELQDHGLKEQKLTNPELADLANRLGVATTCSNDVHYLEEGDVEAHDALCCISTGKLVAEEDRFKFPCGEFYLKSAEQMRELFKDYPDAIDNTMRIADLCELELDFSKRYAPVYKVEASTTPEAELRRLVYEGAHRKYDAITDELRERIDYELDVISSKGFSSYFLIVWDLMRFARDNDIPCGARGSGCSSVVGYCLDISAPDPMRYGLYFERFMDPDRDEMPDIDVDMCQVGRQRVIEYVRQKYGYVAQIITFNTLKAKAAVKDVSRVMGIGFDEANELTKLIPNELKMTIDKALEQETELRKKYDNDERVHKVIDIARKLEGLSRNAGIHAAGVVVADRPLEQFVPLYKPANDDQICTQYEGGTVERVGLLKMDFLGLRTLTTLERARQLAEQRTGERIDLDGLDLNDPKVYALFARGDTKGIFQFESGGMRDVIMRMKPNRIEDLIAANALYRPGPMKYIDTYIARKHGESWTTPHPIMTEQLEETFGIMVYQEQVSRIVNRLGGIELKRAFRLAKVISKKKIDKINEERQPFIDGCVANGVSKETAEQIFEDILEFGGYAFNKAHSTGYSLIAFQTAYMKVYHPVEFMAALMTFEMSNTDKILEYADEARRLEIAVLPPDVNSSQNDFAVVPGPGGNRDVIRFGMAAVKGVGEKAVDAIVREREDRGRYKSLFDFCERVDLTAVNRSVVEALINCGAFDTTGAMRKAMILAYERAYESGARTQKDRRSGQMGLFGDAVAASDHTHEPTLGTEEWSESEMLAREKAALGLYVTAHPLTHTQPLLDACKSASVGELSDERFKDGDLVTLGGMVTQVRTVIAKGGRNPGSKMGVASFEDLSGSIEAILFTEVLKKYQTLVHPDALIFIIGEVDKRRETAAVRVREVIPAQQAWRKFADYVLLSLAGSGADEQTLAKLHDVCMAHRGSKPIYIDVPTAAGEIATVKCGDDTRVEVCDDFLRQAYALLGVEHVTLCTLNRSSISQPFIHLDEETALQPPVGDGTPRQAVRPAPAGVPA